MECDGKVTGWEFYALSAGQIYLGLWDYNPEGHTFTLTGKNLVTVGTSDTGQSKVCRHISVHCSETCGCGDTYIELEKRRDSKIIKYEIDNVPSSCVYKPRRMATVAYKIKGMINFSVHKLSFIKP